MQSSVSLVKQLTSFETLLELGGQREGGGEDEDLQQVLAGCGRGSYSFGVLALEVAHLLAMCRPQSLLCWQQVHDARKFLNRHSFPFTEWGRVGQAVKDQ